MPDNTFMSKWMLATTRAYVRTQQERQPQWEAETKGFARFDPSARWQDIRNFHRIILKYEWEWPELFREDMEPLFVLRKGEMDVLCVDEEEPQVVATGPITDRTVLDGMLKIRADTVLTWMERMERSLGIDIIDADIEMIPFEGDGVAMYNCYTQFEEVTPQQKAIIRRYKPIIRLVEKVGPNENHSEATQIRWNDPITHLFELFGDIERPAKIPRQ